MTSVGLTHRGGAHLVHGAVVVERSHAAHALVDVVAVDTNEQHHDCRDGSPDDLQGQVALDRSPIGQIADTTAEAQQAEHQQADDAEEKNRADAEQDTKQSVVNRRVGAGVEGQ